MGKNRLFTNVRSFRKGKPTRMENRTKDTHLGNGKISGYTAFYFVELYGAKLRSPTKDQINKMRKKLLMNKSFL